MPASYPFHLRTVLRASKARSQPPAFSLSEPRRGFAYAQATGTDTPVFFEVTFRFTEVEAQSFRLWFRYVINQGVDEFTMPIRTEFGVLTHSCRFAPDRLLDLREEGELFTYSAVIMAREEIIPAAMVSAGPTIAGLPNWSRWAALLDQVITSEMPT